MTTPQTVIPLEETAMYLQQMLQYDPVDAPGVFSVGCDAATNRGRILRSALHHLEAGKLKRYTPEDMLLAAIFGPEHLTQNFPELDLSSTPTEEPRG